MNVINRKALVDFINKHADPKGALESWFYEIKHANWARPRDIKERYATASFLSDNKVVFNIKGNRYRLLVKIAYETRTVFIKWVGTYSEYDKQNF